MVLLIVTFEVEVSRNLSKLDGDWRTLRHRPQSLSLSRPFYSNVSQGAIAMANKDPNYSWKGSPNAGKVLMIGAALFGLLIILAGFSG